ncbi:LOW QUALITY PROTEIN: beta-1,3-galactosyltransferase 2-like [Camarhynchus parvulus]|uniref:LOW QUALITY PROTEIN: beta-1,3-galactosyltransferase 2-like n=1 Tax=Geospiza parvula TaxID=87175 RepID=UPI00123814D1|nr:LOW QUALITY PROTEIN: beta-1,3-galactosyltransferase 2-like [Camarhynchus parvulus]
MHQEKSFPDFHRLFTIYLISYFCHSSHLAAQPKSNDLHMESEKSLLRKLSTNFKQISGKQNGELPPENEKSGNKATPTPENEKSGNKATPTPENEKSGNKAMPTPTRPFAFIINEEEKCKGRTPFLVLLISTTAAEVERRNAIRRSWGSEGAVLGADVIRLFMLGSDTEGDGDVLLRESEQHHDIIQQDFLDTYNNLTLKTLMGMSWVASYCSDTRFAMKTDSDVFVNTMHLIEKLLRPLPPPTQNYFTGHLMAGNSPIRNKASKWYISEEEFPGNRYHPFCSGTGYVFSGDLAAKIVEASLMIKFIHLEDVYVGFCLHAKGVEIVPPPYSLFNIRKVPFSPCAYNELITSHHIEPHEHILYWETLQEKKHMCKERKVHPGES